MSSEEKAERLRRALASGGLRSTGVIRATADRVRTITADPAEVIPNADMVIIVVPAFAHGALLRRIRPCVSERTAIGCMPARGGFEFGAAQLAAVGGDVPQTLFGLQTLPWSTRVTTVGRRTHIHAIKGEVVLAALPAGRAPALAARISKMLGIRVVPARSFLGLTIGNPGQIIHPGLMYSHFRWWRGEEYAGDRVPRLHAEVTDETGVLVERLSEDAVATARALEAKTGGALGLEAVVVPIHEWLRSAYGRLIRDASSVASCFRTGPNQALRAPMVESRPGRFVPEFQHRYLSEDVPFGLVVTRALAEIADVETPLIDEVITWAQSVLQKTYLVDGELRGRDAERVPIPQNHGVVTVSDLIDWYTEADRSMSRLAMSRFGPFARR
ncbi:MAG: NAD/NADP octopine/nopaline dehydrogenase family protein [Solirubrobacterales bacterium]|nr:NAD/NADP octopine/nopaline dehydrogenase family protein [Solirubrobacterales bacterium]MBV9165246.1 NAD/NADP octopine/nopaline dehydrogenase family protein [Solirubrobacterales bacterium]